MLFQSDRYDSEIKTDHADHQDITLKFINSDFFWTITMLLIFYNISYFILDFRTFLKKYINVVFVIENPRNDQFCQKLH